MGNEDYNEMKIHLEYLRAQVDKLDSQMGKLETILSNTYITRTEFEAKFQPVQRLAYASVLMIISGFFAGVVAVIWKG